MDALPCARPSRPHDPAGHADAPKRAVLRARYIHLSGFGRVLLVIQWVLAYLAPRLCPPLSELLVGVMPAAHCAHAANGGQGRAEG
jgi:hypothetical protein